MYARLSSYISQGVYTVSGPFHPFGGAVDIIVVQQPDGSFKSSPWYIKFGKFQGVLKTKEKVVNICVNGAEAEFHMYLDSKGEAYFLREVDGEEGDSIFSPMSSGDEMDENSQNGRLTKSKSCDFDTDQPHSDTPIDACNGKIVTRMNSRRSRLLGLMFGRKSMKEDSRQGEGGGDGVERASSLERAEFAADLMEVKWSTNLPTDRPRKDNASRLSASNMPAEEVDRDLQFNDAQGTGSVLEHDILDNGFDHPALHEATSPCDGEMSNISGFGFGNTESSDEVINRKVCGLRPQEQDIEMTTWEASDLEETHVVISATPTGINEFGVGDTGFDGTAKGSVSETTVPDLQNPHLAKLEVGPSWQSDTEQASHEKDGLLRAGVSEEESGSERVSSYIYCELLERSRVEVDVSGVQALEIVNLSHGGLEEVQVHTEVLYETAQLISEVNTRQESGVLVTKENSNDLGSLSDRDSCKFPNIEAVRENEGTSMNSVTKSITEAHSSVDITSDSAEVEILEVIHPKTMTQVPTGGTNLETEPVEVFENQSRIMDFSYSCTSGNNEVSLEDPSTAPQSHAQMVSVDRILGSVEEAESLSICTSLSLGNSTHQAQEEENLGEENKMNTLHPSLDFVGYPQGWSIDHLPTKVTNSSIPIPPSESLEEDQFLFSDIDDFVPSGIQCKDSISPDSMETENHHLVTLDDIKDENRSTDIFHKLSSSSDKLVQEFPSIAHEALLEESRTTSSPISIPISRKGAMEEVEWMIESLPNIRTHIDSLETSDVVHPLSHSLDLRSNNLKWQFFRNHVSSSLKLDPDFDHDLLKQQPEVEGSQTLEELKNLSTNHAVEISLCKHLLYEGMGAHAASEAFDVEKVDLEKFVSLGPALVENDRLIVRISGRYFPWDAAAPIILGMVSFGHEQVFEPEGMIAVDRVEKNLEGDSSRAIVASGGSWRLWPFSFRRSRTMSSVGLASDDTKGSDAENASESTNDMFGDKNMHKVKVAKKKVRSTVPTSDQLDSLNLKEGKNVITFTFSTAMLGKQQVDARIYLWKWNTRIVVSDVDGTITKSDVLGQFMPLVGKDWSQTGVAHLFSAIKENGYQLLFLSARSISQAYLTRQFLFNLKQDGKALPDGPVVISPDGLFPSLFREVIRRAPHEFKIACLKDIRALFPPDCNPFYAGFGNRNTDEISYLKVGIPKGKIFIINPKGEVAVSNRVNTKSYTSLHALVNGMFPAMSSAEQEDFNSWNYWKMPLPDINI